MSEATGDPQQMREQADAEAYRTRVLADEAERPQRNRVWRKVLIGGLVAGGVGLGLALFGPAILGGLGGVFASGGAAVETAMLAGGATAKAAGLAAASGTALESIVLGLQPLLTAGAGLAAAGGLTVAAGAGVRQAFAR